MAKRKNQEPPQGLSVAAQAMEALWGSGLRRLVTIAGGVGVIATAIVSTTNAWPRVEPYTFATSGYVREHVRSSTDPIRVVQSQQSVAIDRFILYQLQESLDKAKKDPAAATSQIVRDRIEQLEDQIKKTEERVRKAPN